MHARGKDGRDEHLVEPIREHLRLLRRRARLEPRVAYRGEVEVRDWYQWGYLTNVAHKGSALTQEAILGAVQFGLGDLSLDPAYDRCLAHSREGRAVRGGY